MYLLCHSLMGIIMCVSSSIHPFYISCMREYDFLCGFWLFSKISNCALRSEQKKNGQKHCRFFFISEEINAIELYVEQPHRFFWCVNLCNKSCIAIELYLSMSIYTILNLNFQFIHIFLVVFGKSVFFFFFFLSNITKISIAISNMPFFVCHFFCSHACCCEVTRTDTNRNVLEAPSWLYFMHNRHRLWELVNIDDI